jgi:hypothetical protein
MASSNFLANISLTAPSLSIAARAPFATLTSPFAAAVSSARAPDASAAAPTSQPPAHHALGDGEEASASQQDGPSQSSASTQGQASPQDSRAERAEAAGENKTAGSEQGGHAEKKRKHMARLTVQVPDHPAVPPKTPLAAHGGGLGMPLVDAGTDQGEGNGQSWHSKSFLAGISLGAPPFSAASAPATSSRPWTTPESTTPPNTATGYNRWAFPAGVATNSTWKPSAFGIEGDSLWLSSLARDHGYLDGRQGLESQAAQPLHSGRSTLNDKLEDLMGSLGINKSKHKIQRSHSAGQRRSSKHAQAAKWDRRQLKGFVLISKTSCKPNTSHSVRSPHLPASAPGHLASRDHSGHSFLTSTPRAGSLGKSRSVCVLDPKPTPETRTPQLPSALGPQT